MAHTLDIAETRAIYDRMDNDRPLPPPRAIPARALSRQMRMGTTFGGMMGATLGGALGQMMRGGRPDLAAAALTPANALRLAGGLSNLRGAAMKLGQMLSMDSGFALPAELESILAQLRASAPPMPPAQLRAVLNAAWGRDWQRRFARFDVRPLAAASIGQVHRAHTRDGRDLAIKVQFPGVRGSIDADIDTLGRLLRLPGLIPAGMDIAPLLTEARAQLHDEADYTREAQALRHFSDALAGSDGLILPKVHDDLSTGAVLAMDYIASRPIETLLDAPQALRNDVTARLITLVLREIFELGAMQTDPNFANYRVTDDNRIVLLDFGATRYIGAEVAAMYRRLLGALLAEDREATGTAMEALGYFSADVPPERVALILDLAAQASAPLRMDAPYDFARSTLIRDLAQAGAPLGTARDFWHVPPGELLFLHRKIGGMFLLAQRLRAEVALHPLVSGWA